MVSLYCDGGVIGRNPSSVGGTWAWVHVADDGRTRTCSDSGSVTPIDVGLPTVTNNLTELLAAVRGLESLPDEWDGTVYTDSMITKHRLTGSRKFVGIPEWLVERLRFVQARLGQYRVVLLGGHPTVADLARGSRSDGTPVSPHNAFVDRLCGEESQRFRRQSEVVLREQSP